MKTKIAVPLNVLKVLRRLRRFGYQAFLVGGCVRDHLLGYTPKDWDVSTDATPEEIRSVFDNSRTVGKRFPVVHVCFGRGEIIEVVTFRTDGDEYGTMVDDAYRRDFTVNALYYDETEGEIIDPFTGLQDLQDRAVVCIGTPDTRFYDDPVRMLRAARLVQLGLRLSEEVKLSVLRNNTLLSTVNASRLYCEFVKSFSRCVQANSMLTLQGLGLLEQFFPRKMYHQVEPWHGELPVHTIIAHMVQVYHSDLTGACTHDFSLHPIPASQKAASMLVGELRGQLNMDRVTALRLKLQLHEMYLGV
jgi:poly(A) polymerase